MEENPKWIIREIENFDDKELNNVLSSVMIEYGVPKKGTALSDPEPVSYTHLTLPTIRMV